MKVKFLLLIFLVLEMCFTSCNVKVHAKDSEKNISDEIIIRSENWKESKNPDDLKWLLENAIKKGMSCDSVILILGEPIKEVELKNDLIYLVYLVANIQENIPYNGGVYLDSNKKVKSILWIGFM